MEGSPITYESNVMQFCVIAIQTAARKMNIPAAELTPRLEAQGLIDGRLIKFYDTLHTQSAQNVADMQGGHTLFCKGTFFNITQKVSEYWIVSLSAHQ